MRNILTKKIAFLLTLLIITIPAISRADGDQIPMSQIDKIVVFGDSLSDTGYLYKYSGYKYPSNPPYFNGRCSSGYLWIDWIARDLNYFDKLLSTNYAFAGSKVKNLYPTSPFDPNPDPDQVPLDLSNFVASYLLSLGFTPPTTNNALYVIWDGSNDYLSVAATQTSLDENAYVTNVINALQAQIQKLITQAHAKYFFIPSIVDLSVTPMARENPYKVADYDKLLKRLSQAHNDKLKDMINNLKTTNPDIKIATYDMFSAIHDIIDHPPDGLTNVTDPCYTGTVLGKPITNNAVYTMIQEVSNAPTQCANPSKHLFWDSVHPTAVIHKNIADRVHKTLFPPTSSEEIGH